MPPVVREGGSNPHTLNIIIIHGMAEKENLEIVEFNAQYIPPASGKLEKVNESNLSKFQTS